MRISKVKISYNIIMIGSVLLASLIISGCGINDLKSEADSVCQELLKDLSKGDYDHAALKYADIFFVFTPKEKWQQFNKDFVKQVGDMLEFELLSWHIEKPPHPNRPIVATYEYRVTYEKIISIQHIVLNRMQNEQLKVIKHLYDVERAEDRFARERKE